MKEKVVLPRIQLQYEYGDLAAGVLAFPLFFYNHLDFYINLKSTYIGTVSMNLAVVKFNVIHASFRRRDCPALFRILIKFHTNAVV